MISYELNLRDYFRIIRKRRSIILFIFVAVNILSFTLISKRPKIFKATTTLKVGERKTVAGLLTEMIVYSPGDIMMSYKELVEGHDVMKRVALSMNLLSPDAPIDDEYDVISRLQNKITVELLDKTNLLQITAQDTDPDRVVELVNTTGRIFIEENLLEKNKQARTVRTYIEEQLAQIEDRIRKGEETIRAFDESQDILSMNAPLEEHLSKLEFELVDLMQLYTDKHPRVLHIKDKIAQIQSHIKQNSIRSLDYDSLKRQIEINKKLYSVLKEKLEEARISEVQKIEDITVVNPAVKPKRPINPEKNVSLFFGGILSLILGLVCAFLIESFDTSLGTIEDVESILKLPVLGVVPSVRNKKDRKKGVWAKFKAKEHFGDVSEQYVRMIVHNEPKSSISESYRTIRTNLQISPERKTFLVTSAGPREGKTTTIINLGLAIAQAGMKTLIVSSDLRKPAIAQTFGIHTKPGLYEAVTNALPEKKCIRSIADMIMGEIGLAEIIKTPGIENLYIMPAGQIPHNPAELLSTSKMQKLHEYFVAEYDVILYDSPPVLPITDAALISNMTDAVILVYEAGRTSRNALARVKVQLESAGANIIGVVLNHTSKEVDINVTFPYYKNKYYHYYSYYGENSST